MNLLRSVMFINMYLLMNFIFALVMSSVLYIGLLTTFLSAELLKDTYYCPLGKKPIKNTNTDTTECTWCLKCPAEYGVSDSCYNNIVVNSVECLKCDDECYSENYDTEMCQPCRPKCGLNEREKHRCTKRHNRECECKPGWVKNILSTCMARCCKCKTKRLVERYEDCMKLNIGMDCQCEEQTTSSTFVDKVTVQLLRNTATVVTPTSSIFKVNMNLSETLEIFTVTKILPSSSVTATRKRIPTFPATRKIEKTTTRTTTTTIKSTPTVRYNPYLSPTSHPSTTLHNNYNNIHKKLDEGVNKIDRNNIVSIVLIVLIGFLILCLFVVMIVGNRTQIVKFFQDVQSKINYSPVGFEQGIRLSEIPSLHSILNPPDQPCFEDCDSLNQSDHMLLPIEEVNYINSTVCVFLDSDPEARTKIKIICNLLFSNPVFVYQCVMDQNKVTTNTLLEHIYREHPYLFTVKSLLFLLKAAGMEESGIKAIHQSIHSRCNSHDNCYESSC